MKEKHRRRKHILIVVRVNALMACGMIHQRKRKYDFKYQTRNYIDDFIRNSKELESITEKIILKWVNANKHSCLIGMIVALFRI